ncbi:MAG: hypothetical protein M4D80_27775 [Myxococcota bacterium]|nr:hypothetical protein [Myxococcota bacterium]
MTGATCADGSTLDLDGDGILWCDDPVESFMLSTPTRGIAGAVHHDAVAVLISATCDIGDPCPHTLFAANSRGKLIVRSDSTLFGDAWANRIALGGPFVSRYGHIYVSRRESQFVGDTVTLDPATTTVTVRANPMLSAPSIRDATNQPALGMMWLQPYAPFTLVEPQSDGSLTSLAMSNNFFRPNSFGFDPFLPMSPAMFVETSGNVRTFRPGDTALSELSPPASAVTTRSVITAAGVALCVSTATSAVLYEQTASAITSTPFPFRGCTFRTRVVGSHTLYEGSGPDVNGDGQFGHAVYRRTGATFEPVVVDRAWPLRVVGDDFIVVVEQVSDAPQPVWIYRPGSPAELVVADLENVDASVAGDVAHILGVRRTALMDGPLTLIRVKTGAPNQTLELRPNASVAAPSAVVTTKEGAAVAGYIGLLWIAPSFSFAVEQSAGQLEGGGVRGSHTVVMMKSGAFAYREVGGVPELVLLTPINGVFDVPFTPIDSPVLPASEWFKFEDSFSGLCAIGRVKETAQGPTLDSVACTQDKHRVIGTSADGSLFVANDNGNGYHRELFKLSPAGPETIATGVIAGVTAFHDYSRGARVIGWTTAGHSVCLDEQPRRCWAIPAGTHPIDTVLESDGSKHQVAQLLVNETQSGALISIVRSIGPGKPSI